MLKQERLDWIADSRFYTKRSAFHVRHRCRASSIQDVARELHLDWKTFKELDKQYMREQLRRAGTAGPRVAGSGDSDRSGSASSVRSSARGKRLPPAHQGAGNERRDGPDDEAVRDPGPPQGRVLAARDRSTGRRLGQVSPTGGGRTGRRRGQ